MRENPNKSAFTTGDLVVFTTKKNTEPYQRYSVELLTVTQEMVLVDSVLVEWLTVAEFSALGPKKVGYVKRSFFGLIKRKIFE